ncbi:MAG: hypothetical protein ACRDNK_10910 [Solirubrobacteraceae bacterium]
MSLSAAAPAEPTMPALRFFDVVLVIVAAPILLLIGVPALGYLVGAGAWLALRAVGVGAERLVGSTPEASRQITIRMAFMFARLFLLALAVIVARQSSQGDGLTALVVIVLSFTIALGLSAANRPRPR